MLPRKTDGLLTRTMPSKWDNLAIALLVLVPSIIDFCASNRINPSSIYVLALVVYAQTRRARHIGLFAVLLVVLTFVFFSLDVREILQSGDSVRLPRILNRVFTASAIVASAILLKTWIAFRDYWSNQSGALGAAEKRRPLLAGLVHIFDQFIATGLVIFIILALLLADIFTPVYYNFPILYAIPMIIAALTLNRPLIWTTLIVALLAGFIGYQFGHAGYDRTMRAIVAANRLIAACTLLGMALLFHVWVSRAVRGAPPAPTNAPSPL
jgi:hypothetical protein